MFAFQQFLAPAFLSVFALAFYFLRNAYVFNYFSTKNVKPQEFIEKKNFTQDLKLSVIAKFKIFESFAFVYRLCFRLVWPKNGNANANRHFAMTFIVIKGDCKSQLLINYFLASEVIKRASYDFKPTFGCHLLHFFFVPFYFCSF